MTRTTLTIMVDDGMLAALAEAAQVHTCTVEDVIQNALHAYMLPTMRLNLAALAEAVLLDHQMMRDHPELGPLHVTEEMVEAVRQFMLPADRVRMALGDALWTRLVHVPGDAELTEEVGARQTAVTEVCEVLRGVLTGRGVRR